jgi:transposase
MDVLYPRCAGLDVHAKQVTVCLRLATDATVTHEQRTFPTTTKGVLALGDWLTEQQCTHAAMEATGVYWKPVWHLLEHRVTLILANALHLRHVPGRKSDVNDATWIADLLAHGLIRSSFVPPAHVQALRDLTRTRKQLVGEIARHTQRLQKVLEDANLKLTQVVSDLLGVSGRAVLHALIAGETDPARLADLTQGRLKASRTALLDALHGRVTAHHRFLLQLHLTQIEALERGVADLERHLEDTLGPVRTAVSLLTTMPGVSDTVARVMVAEIGTDMTRFPSAGHWVSWAGLCPRLHESAGKHRPARLRHATPWLRATLIQAGWAETRTRGSYLQAQFLRLKSRRGPKKAIVAVAASMLTAAYFMLRDGVEYHDLGAGHFDGLRKADVAQRLIRRLCDLGVDVVPKIA